MEALIRNLALNLRMTFHDKTVGGGGDFGAEVSDRGPFAVSTFFHQFESVSYPSISMQVVNETHLGQPLECCGGGVHVLQINFRIAVKTKEQGWSIASALHEAVREWLCQINAVGVLDDGDNTVIPHVKVPDTHWIFEGDFISVHVIARIYYLRQTKGEL